MNSYEVEDVDTKWGVAGTARLKIINGEEKYCESICVGPIADMSFWVALSGLVEGEVDIRKTQYYLTASNEEKAPFRISECFKYKISIEQRAKLMKKFYIKALQEEIKSGNFSNFLREHSVKENERVYYDPPKTNKEGKAE